jgi:hypothetical protein
MFHRNPTSSQSGGAADFSGSHGAKDVPFGPADLQVAKRLSHGHFSWWFFMRNVYGDLMVI